MNQSHHGHQVVTKVIPFAARFFVLSIWSWAYTGQKGQRLSKTPAISGISFDEFGGKNNPPFPLFALATSYSQIFGHHIQILPYHSAAMESAMSLRTPEDPTQFNNADNIERYLQEDGHRIWGFVIYRCTYFSDADWDIVMSYLRSQIQRILQMDNGLDMLSSLRLTVFSDPSLYANASTSAIRAHFTQWAATAPAQEQGAGMSAGLSQRYRYCIMVDAEALNSVLREGSEPETLSDGFVNLIWKDWEPEPPRPNRRETPEEPIEGCTRHDVGWMRVAYQDVGVGMYYYLRDYNDRYREYRRPPEVARG